MRILEIVFKDPRESPGGVESMSTSLTEGLNMKGVETITIFQIYRKQLRSYIIADQLVGLGTPLPDKNILLPLNKLLFNILLMFYVRRHAKEFDWIHINGDAGPMLSTRSEFKTLLTLHGSSLLTYRKTRNLYGIVKRVSLFLTSVLSYLLERHAIRHSTKVVCVSRQVMEAFSVDLEPERTQLIYNGVDVTRYLPAKDKNKIRASISLDTDSPIAIWVGRNPLRKGLGTAVKAVECAAAFKLIVAGSNILGSDLTERILPFGKVDNEKLIGLYQASDVFLFPSLYEGFSIAVLEAMACGLVPVIYSSNSSSEILEDSTDSFVLDDEDEFRSILTYLEDHREKLEELGKMAQKKAVQFSSENMCDLYFSLLSSQ